MRISIFISLFFLILFSGCELEHHEEWNYYGYKLSEHNVVPDSAYVASYGVEGTKSMLKFVVKDSWIKDSIPILNASFKKRTHELFLLLLFIQRERKKEKYGLDFSISNDKNQIKLLDSIHYSITDSSTSENKTGKFIFGKDLTIKILVVAYPDARVLSKQ